MKFDFIPMFFLLTITIIIHFFPDVSAKAIGVSTKFARYTGRRDRYSYDIQGTTIKEVDTFFKIRYAEPPTGSDRFKSPVSLRRQRGEQDATKPPPYCPQTCEDISCSIQQIQEDEDCLYLNIFSPYEPDEQNRTYPVMVYIHGGSYQLNGGRDYRGNALSRYGVVFISINYRLGIFGFLSTGDKFLPGNYGIQDQIAALQWVQENIYLFRGDPSKVTIVGHSAGSSSVNILLTLPATKGLFRYAIAQSGSVESYFALYPPHTNFKHYFAQILRIYDCPHDFEQGLSCLRRIGWRDVFSYKKIAKIPPYNGMDTSWRPRIDGTLIPEHPYLRMKAGQVNAQKLITGVTNNEVSSSFRLFLWELILEKKVPDFTHRGLTKEELILALNHSSELFKFKPLVSETMKFLYTANTNMSDTNTNRQTYIHVFNDYIMVAPTIKVADAIANTTIPIYLYYYTHFPKGCALDKWYRAFHGMELSPMFGAFFIDYYPEVTKEEYNGSDLAEMKRLSTNFMSMWTNFVKNGEPVPLKDQPQWPRYTPSSRSYAEISDRISIKQNLRQTNIKFWNELVPTLKQITTQREQQMNNSCDCRRHHGGGGVTAAAVIWLLTGICIILIIFMIIFVTVVRCQRHEDLKRRRASRRASHMLMVQQQRLSLTDGQTANSELVPR